MRFLSGGDWVFLFRQRFSGAFGCLTIVTCGTGGAARILARSTR